MALGLSPDVLRGRRFRRVLHGVHVTADTLVTSGLVARAALLRLPDGAVISHCSAAEAYRLPIPDCPTPHVTLDDPSGRHRPIGVRMHRRRLPPGDVVLRAGMPMTTPVRTFVDLRECLTLVDLVVVGDALLRAGRGTISQLRDAAGRSGRHCRNGRRAAALVRDRVDSPMETRLRLMIVLAGLPEPWIAQDVVDRDGGWIARVDLSYPRPRLRSNTTGSSICATGVSGPRTSSDGSCSSVPAGG